MHPQQDSGSSFHFVRNDRKQVTVQQPRTSVRGEALARITTSNPLRLKPEVPHTNTHPVTAQQPRTSVRGGNREPGALARRPTEPVLFETLTLAEEKY